MNEKTNNTEGKELERPIFKEANAVLAANQDQYNTLAVNINPELETIPVTAMFILTPDQLKEVEENGGAFYITQLTFGNNYHPIAVDTQKPETLSKLTKDEIMAFHKQRLLDQKRAEVAQLEKDLGVSDEQPKTPLKKVED